MPKQTPEDRVKNFDEVAQGYPPDWALGEASRCIQCPKQPCVTGCPVEVDIPGFIRAICELDLPEAVRILKSKNSLPGICGRVCPQETQCEAMCTLAKKGAPLAVGRLERFVADWELVHKSSVGAESPLAKRRGKKVAVVGSGPAGLVCAADLAKLGYQVTIFEALHAAGGVLMYGIPEFRLPKRIVQAEVDYVKSLGVDTKLDWVVGRIISVDELLHDGFAAVFLGTGAGSPMFLNIPGENLSGIYSANEFLTRVNLMKAYLFPEYRTPINIGKVVVVIGGGNVAVDAARCALRLRAKEVRVIYRRSRAEMPARQEEIENATAEGIDFRLLVNPKRFIGDEMGNVTGIECYEMGLGAPDETGRPRPVIKPGSEFIVPADTVIVALGTTPNPLISQTTEDLKIAKQGTIIADGRTGQTSKRGVWAGGDITTGAATVISAMGAGRRAATAIDTWLRDFR